MQQSFESLPQLPHHLPLAQGNVCLHVKHFLVSFSADYSWLAEHRIHVRLELLGQVHDTSKRQDSTAVYRWRRSTEGRQLLFRANEISIQDGSQLALRVFATETEHFRRSTRKKIGDGRLHAHEVGVFLVSLSKLAHINLAHTEELSFDTSDFFHPRLDPPHHLPPARCSVTIHRYDVARGTRIANCEAYHVAFTLVTKSDDRYNSVWQCADEAFSLGQTLYHEAEVNQNHGLYIFRTATAAAQAATSIKFKHDPDESEFAALIVLACVCEGPFVEYDKHRIICSALTPVMEVLSGFDGWPPETLRLQQCSACHVASSNKDQPKTEQQTLAVNRSMASLEEGLLAMISFDPGSTAVQVDELMTFLNGHKKPVFSPRLSCGKQLSAWQLATNKAALHAKNLIVLVNGGWMQSQLCGYETSTFLEWLKSGKDKHIIIIIAGVTNEDLQKSNAGLFMEIKKLADNEIKKHRNGHLDANEKRKFKQINAQSPTWKEEVLSALIQDDVR